MKPHLEERAAQMLERARARLNPQRVRSDTERKRRADAQRQYREYAQKLKERKQILELPPIHPSVLAATADDLIRAGYGEMERSNIPADWKSRAHSREHGAATEERIQTLTKGESW